MMTFLGRFFQKKVEEGISTFTEAIVAFDPETATEAEISGMEEELRKASLALAQARQDYERENTEAVAVRKAFDQKVAAAGKLQERMDTESDPIQKDSLEKSLTKLVGQLENQRADVEREEEEAVEAKQFLDELTEGVETIGKSLKEARGSLKSAELAMKRAAADKERSERSEEKVMAVEGIKQSGSRMDTALKAMQKRTENLKKEADASKTRARVLSTSDEADPNIAAALAEVSDQVPVASVADRLADLRKKSA